MSLIEAPASLAATMALFRGIWLIERLSLLVVPSLTHLGRGQASQHPPQWRQPHGARWPQGARVPVRIHPSGRASLRRARVVGVVMGSPGPTTQRKQQGSSGRNPEG